MSVSREMRLVWQPMMRIVYETRNTYDVLWEYVLPSITGAKLGYILLSRRNIYRMSYERPCDGLEIDYKPPKPDEILNFVREVHRALCKAEQKGVSRGDAFTLVLAKMSATLKLFKEHEERVEKIFGESISRKLLKTIIEDGLGFKGDEDYIIKSYSIVKYPLLIDKRAYEIIDVASGKCIHEKRYTRYFKDYVELRNFYSGLLSTF